MPFHPNPFTPPDLYRHHIQHPQAFPTNTHFQPVQQQYPSAPTQSRTNLVPKTASVETVTTTGMADVGRVVEGPVVPRDDDRDDCEVSVPAPEEDADDYAEITPDRVEDVDDDLKNTGDGD